ncbi:DUF3311 domain-containing protein [Fodinisporobacter ferrooxydans]|uniref:DUF3311 domain-containing protein n=1 Tax=Fodinisporobacter ferrooxydans TaxID=2901836 RepID=A0ABY4CHH4_9BACL|nr:DUF3311 domain-containing protein [Alicyclobacillaceae bacterium MYW30-H2]
MNDQQQKKSELTAWHLLLIIPFIATLWMPFYASKDPVIWGIPYFYFYQSLWVVISAILTGIVYFATKNR